jgi:hypothetical protein
MNQVSPRRSVWIPLVLAASLVAVGWGVLRSDGTTAPSEPTVAPLDGYDPVTAGEPLPEGYRRGLDRDQIEPVYDPVFAPADTVDWPQDSLVIGVAGAETAKAYPVTHLNSREMIIDSLDGIPILVSW